MNAYDRGFMTVLPFRFDEGGKPCGKGFISKNKNCRTQGADFTPEESRQIASSMKTLNDKRRKLEGWSDRHGWDEESPNNPKYLGVDDRKYSSTREWEFAWSNAREKIQKSKPKGYFSVDWGVEDEYEAKALLGLTPGEIDRVRSSTVTLRKKVRNARNKKDILAALGISAASAALILGGAALSHQGGR